MKEILSASGGFVIAVLVMLLRDRLNNKGSISMEKADKHFVSKDICNEVSSHIRSDLIETKNDTKQINNTVTEIKTDIKWIIRKLNGNSEHE